MKKIINVLTYLPLGLLTLTYAWHGVSSLLMGEEYTTTVAALGFNNTVNALLLITVGLLDCTVAILLLFKNMLFPQLPSEWLFLYVGAWPIVPRILQWMGGSSFAWIEVLIFASITALAYYLQNHREEKPFEKMHYTKGNI